MAVVREGCEIVVSVRTKEGDHEGRWKKKQGDKGIAELVMFRLSLL